MALPAFAALPGVRRAARLRGAVQRTLPVALASLLATTLPGVAHAQESDGPIVIPGNGEKNPADAQALAARIQAAPRARPAAVSLASLRPTSAAQRAANAEEGQIVIAGSGEPADQGAATVYATSGALAAPGARAMAAYGATSPGAPAVIQRVNVQTGARQIAPVMVAPVMVNNAAVRYSAPVPQPVAQNQPAGDTSAPIEIEPLAARGEPPRLDGAGGSTAAVKTRVSVAPTASATPTQVAQVQVAQAAQAAQNPRQLTPQAAAQLAQAQAARGGQRSAAGVGAGAAGSVPLEASAAVPAGQQDAESIRAAASTFLQQQTAGLPGKITITVAPAFPRGLAACTALEPFMPVGARLWGRTSVGVRCAGARPWTIYLQARISLQATYYTAARQITPGETLSAADLVAHDGDLATLPQAVVTDPAQAVGSIAMVRIGAGLTLRQDLLKSAASVTIGQTVRVIAAGEGFSISSEGSVMNNASPGQQVRVKTATGQIVTGIVKDSSTVEIQL